MTQDSIDKLSGIGVDFGPTLERFVDNEALYLKCIRTFVLNHDYSDMINAIEAGDASAAFDAAHALKGVTGNLGFTYLYEEIKVITEVFRAKSMDFNPENLERIKSEYKKAIDTILSVTD